MNLKRPVSEFMEENIVVISPEISIGKAMKIMNKKNVKYLAIVNDEAFQGIVSIYDCEYFKSTLIKDGVFGPDEILRLKHHNVSEIMRTKLVKLDSSDTCELASEIMKSIIFQVILIVEKRKLIGILTPELVKSCRIEEQVSMR